MTDRKFTETDVSNLPLPPVLFGIAGPPGGGKTKSALRIADGIARVRGGKPALIDTEAGRSLKYLRGPLNPNGHDFHHFPFKPPFTPEDFLSAIRQALAVNPAAVIIDSMSDEHEGEGGYLDWHDAEVPKSGGNEWAAWRKPSMSRRKTLSGVQQIATPLIFTFRAREKTKQVGKKIVPMGFTPIAPPEVVHTLDLFCLLPLKANGVATWQSTKEGEDFAIKYPEFLSPLIKNGSVLNEDLGEALALWQSKGISAALAGGSTTEGGEKRRRTPEEMVDDYVARVNSINDRAELMSFQQLEGTVKFVNGLRDKQRADLVDRIVTANTRRAMELTPSEPESGYQQGESDNGD